MKAMIMAAGLGTRLRPLTDNKPKALVEVAGSTLLEHVIVKLRSAGVTSVIVNAHHFAEQITAFVKSHDLGIPVAISDESNLLLETGGGLKKARWFFDDNQPFVVCNVDVLSGITLQHVYEAHKKSEALATLVVKQRQSSRYFLFDRNLQLCGWKNTSTGELKVSREAGFYYPYAFSGIQILSPEIFEYITEQGRFLLTNMYLRLATDHAIQAYVDDSWWFDLGKFGDIQGVEEFLK